MSDREVIEHWKTFHRDLCKVLGCTPTVSSELLLRIKRMKETTAKVQSENRNLKRRIRQLGKVIGQASTIVKTIAVEESTDEI